MKRYVIAILLGLAFPASAGAESVWRSKAGTEITAVIESLDWDNVELRSSDGKLLKVPVDALAEEDGERARTLFKHENPLSVVMFGQPLFDDFITYNWFKPATIANGWKPTLSHLDAKKNPFDTQFQKLKKEDLTGLAPGSKRRFLLLEVGANELGSGGAHQKVVKRLSSIQKTCNAQGFTPLIIDPYYTKSEYGQSGRMVSKARLTKSQMAIRAELKGWKTVPVGPVVEAMIASSDDGGKLANDSSSLALIVFGVLFSSVTNEALPLDSWNPYTPHAVDPFARQKSVLDGMNDGDLRAFGEKILELTRKHSEADSGASPRK